MTTMTRLFRCDLLKRDCTASELRELSEVIDRCLYPLGYREAIIFDEVCVHLGVSRVAIHKRDKSDTFRFPRHVVMYLLRQRGYHLSAIGKFFGQSESNVHHAITTMRDRCATEEPTRRLMTTLGRSIDAKLGENGHGAAIGQTKNRHYTYTKNGK